MFIGMSRPNLLVITTDQQRWDALSLFGTPGYRTPHIDRIGREGLTFDRGYTPSPVCTPARVSMITGQQSTRHGAYTIGMAPVPALAGPTLGTELQRAGYRTGIIGKTHFVARRIEDQHVAGMPLDEEAPGEAFWAAFDGPYCGFAFVRHHRHHNAAGIPNAHYRRWLNEKGLDLDALHGEDHRKACGLWEGMRPEWTQNAWIAEETVAFIESSRHATPGQPWFAMANFQDPHYPMICPDPFYSEVDMEGVDLGGFDPHEFDDRPSFYRRFVVDQEYWSEDDGTDHCPRPFGVPNINRYDRYPAREAIRAYIGMTNMVDHYVGQILQHLEATGTLEDTLVVFTSDHGEMLGRHGMWGKGLPAYEDNQRIPALMMWKAAQPRPLGRNGKAHFNLIDLLPTLLDAAEAPLPPFVQGVSQLPVLRGETDCVRDYALIDHLVTPTLDPILHQQTLVHDDWKIVCYQHRPYGELYNLASDPDQKQNRWDDPGARDRKEQMLIRLVQANLEAAGTMPERIAPA